MTPPDSPENISLITYGWVFIMSILGGVTAFHQKVKAGAARAWNFTELIGELCTSAFSGVLAFYICTWSGFAPLLTAAIVGISGHMGSRAIFMIEKEVERRFQSPVDRGPGA